MTIYTTKKLRNPNKGKYSRNYSMDELVEMTYEEVLSIPIVLNPFKKVMVQKYSDMLQRCNNPKSRLYKWYGGKCIRVIITKEEFYKWFYTEFKAFYKKYGMSEIASVGKVENHLNYSLENIELVIMTDNLLEENRRNPNPNPTSNKFDDCVVLMALTVKTPSVDLAKMYGCSNTAFNRMRNGSNWKWIYRGVML